MEQFIYAFICRENPRWDSQDDQYFYKKYAFTKLHKQDLGIIGSIVGVEKTALIPHTFRSVSNKKKLSIIIESLSCGIEEVVVKFYKSNSEVVKEDKELYFFF